MQILKLLCSMILFEKSSDMVMDHKGSVFCFLGFCLFFWQRHAACGILVPLLGTEPSPAVKAQSPNHWTPGNSLLFVFLCACVCVCVCPEKSTCIYSSTVKYIISGGSWTL